MTKIITEEYRKESILHRRRSACGLETVSLRRLLQDEGSEGKDRLLLMLAGRLQKKRGSLPHYGNMFGFPAFIMEILDFASEMALWDIEADDLPERDDSEKELKEILAEALQLDLPEKKMRLKAEVLPEELKNEDVYIADSFQQDHFLYTLLEKLKNILPPERKENAKAEKITFSTALSMRREIESIARRIIAEEKPCNIILCSPADQMPVLEAVFRRCGIPYSYTCGTKKLKLPAAYYSLVRFAFSHEPGAFLDALRDSAFCRVCEADLYAFLEKTMTEIKAPEVLDSYLAALSSVHARRNDPGKPPREAETIRKMEEAAARLFSDIEKSIALLMQDASPAEKLVNAYTVLQDSILTEDETELQAGLSLRASLQNCLPLAESREDALFLAESLASVSASSSALVNDFCMVTDLVHPVDAARVTYITGCASTAYPGFHAKEGLFDESYVRNIAAWPSLEERRNAYMDQLGWIMQSAEELRFSCYTNDFQGREIFPAYEVTSIPGLLQEGVMPCPSLAPASTAPHRLSAETAQKLFTREDEDGNRYIRGSVSSVESWFGCPYRYFIASGLYLRKNDAMNLEPASIGTIQHAVMENVIQDENGSLISDYAEKMDRETILSLIRPYFDAMRAVSPHDDDLIRLSQERMCASLLKSARFLAEYEKSTRLHPAAAEAHFDDFRISPHVRLNGTVDRINYDAGNHMFSVLDYKSSAKDLSEAKVSEGLQLQLLSYLMCAAQLYPGDEPAGTWYFSLKEENISDTKKLAAAKISRTGFKLSVSEFHGEDSTADELVRASRQLSGWRLSERKDVIDSDGRYVAGMKKQYDFEKIRECLEACYEYFYEQLLSGESGALGISVSPVDQACTFCDFRSICRFHGDPREPVHVYGESLQKKEVKPDES